MGGELPHRRELQPPLRCEPVALPPADLGTFLFRVEEVRRGGDCTSSATRWPVRGPRVLTARVPRRVRLRPRRSGDGRSRSRSCWVAWAWAWTTGTRWTTGSGRRCPESTIRYPTLNSWPPDLQIADTTANRPHESIGNNRRRETPVAPVDLPRDARSYGGVASVRRAPASREDPPRPPCRRWPLAFIDDQPHTGTAPSSTCVVGVPR